MPEDWATAVAVVAYRDGLEYGVASAIARWTGQGRRSVSSSPPGVRPGSRGWTRRRRGRCARKRNGAAIVGVSEMGSPAARGIPVYGSADYGA